MPGPQPADPMSELAAGAVATHVLYEAHVQAGFTPDQALQIVIALLLDAARRQ
jgi:hypothetical protein